VSDTLDGFNGSDTALVDVSPKDKPWDEHKLQSKNVSAIYDWHGFDRYAERIKDCGKILTFDLKEDDEGKTHLKLSHALFCRVRWCPICQWRHSLSWRARFLKAIPKILSDYPKARFLFLTLTVKNCPPDELRATLLWMNKGWERLIQRKAFPALGFIKAVEVTRGKDGSAHPHFHCLLMVRGSYFSKGYVSQAKWVELWKECLRVDYDPVIDVRAVKVPKDKETGNLAKDMIAAICEVAKYSVKESDLIADDNWLITLTEQMHKMRAISLGGIVKEYLSESDPEDLIHIDEEPDEVELTDTDLALVFDWRDIVSKYMLRTDT
jgi:plasmid rolling circle replication initiator protein Rep